MGCGDASGPEARLGRADAAIVNGVLDSEHGGVVQLWNDVTGCSGSIIHVDGDAAFVLTAAHCFDSGPVEWVVLGDDFNAPDRTLAVSESQVHTLYNPQTNDYDFAIMRAEGADADTPFIPALRPQDDTLDVGTTVVHVGFGATAAGDDSNTQRRRGSGVLDQVSAISIGYPQPDEGPCLGDSGGPNLLSAPGGERVAGVSSYGDDLCASYGVSGRVSAVYDDWIAPFIGNPASGAGGGGGDGTSGAGGQWIGPSPGDDDIEASGGCAAAARSDRGSAWIALLLSLLLIRRRNSRE
jgi:secreted trypsin-like serine protease